MANAPYRIDGQEITNSTAEQIGWIGWQIESAKDIYSVRAYPHGHTVYLRNYRRVSSLPNTPLVRQLLDHIQAHGFTR